ncbi:MAG TPA: hypothetical protein VMJ30_03975, partial [Gemmatimonadales bacterium]|nr:hypothetical protein [Gemmatimonadales bacterium]
MRGPAVIKIGGSLATDPATLREVGAAMARLARRTPLVVVPGGGPFADTVRSADQAFLLPASTAHWMAILGMDQYAHLLASVIPDASVVTDRLGIQQAHSTGTVPVLAPSRWLSAADELPHSWDVTSDSLAAYIVMLLGGDRLLLVKPASGNGDAMVDPYFRKALPAGVSWRTAGPREL